MTTQLSQLAVQRFVDNNGNALAGGQLYTYQAGTSTPAATYTDATGGTANTNPVVMNARGEANVWTTGGLAYKFVLKDASGNLIWSVDNITDGSLSSSLAAALASTTDPTKGSALVGYLPTNSGAVGRTISSKLQESISIFDYFTAAQIAVIQSGSGALDCTSVIQSVLNSVTNTSLGLSIYFPPGVYTISASLIIDTNGVRLWATPGTATIKRANAVSPDTMNLLQTGFQGRYGGAPVYDTTIEGFIFDGNKANNPIGVNDNFDEGLNLLYAVRCTVNEVTVRNCGRIGIVCSTGANDSSVFNCKVYDCDEGGIYAETSSNIRFVGNHANNCSTSSFNIGALDFNKVTNGTIIGNTVNGGYDGIYIRNASIGISIAGNSVSNVGRNGIWIFDESIGSSTPKYVAISGNSVVSAAGVPVLVQYANSVSVTGNALNTTGSYGVSFNNTNNISISSNMISGATVANILNNAGNTLVFIDDDAGTWIPTVIGETTAGTATYSIQTGRWTRKGNRIDFTCVISWSAHTGTGLMDVTLPFASNANDPGSVCDMIAYNFSYTGVAQGSVFGGANRMRISQVNNGVYALLNVASTGVLVISGTYEL